RSSASCSSSWSSCSSGPSSRGTRPGAATSCSRPREARDTAGRRPARADSTLVVSRPSTSRRHEQKGSCHAWWTVRGDAGAGRRRGGRDDGLRAVRPVGLRSEEHTSELQSRENLVCRLLLEKKKKQQ